MVSDILSTIVAPSVVAGIVSATISYFQFHKNNRLIYITNERKEWRSDIRKIAEKMDWERSKEEVKGNTYKTMYDVIAFLTEIIFAYVYLITLKLSVDFLFVVSFAVILIPIIMPERKGMNLDQAIEWFKEKDSKFLNSFTKAMGISILCFTASIVIECLLNGKWAQIGSFGTPIAFFIVAFLIRYLYEYRRYALDVSYYQNIELCQMTKKKKWINEKRTES